MSSVYEICPIIENDQYLFRLVEKKDAKDLIKVYGDKFALPFFNSDNCNGDNFYCQTMENMEEAIKYWRMEYDGKGFVRFAIIDKAKGEAIGTIELFRRLSEDYFNDCGILRLDVAREYENMASLAAILEVIVPPAYELFSCSKIATKARVYAVDRIEALKQAGFVRVKEYLVGHDGRTYGDYWERHMNE